MPSYKPLGSAKCSRCGGTHKMMRSPTGAIVADPCRSKPAPVAQERPGLAKVSKPSGKPRPGVEREAAMKSALDAEGYIDTTFDDVTDAAPESCYRRQVPWGILLAPPRGFAADFAFLKARLLVELVGLAHGNYSMLKRDLERERLARSVAWSVLRLDPEWVKDGRAIEEVRKALAGYDGRATPLVATRPTTSEDRA